MECTSFFSGYFDVDKDTLKKEVSATGYDSLSVESVPYEKKG